MNIQNEGLLNPEPTGPNGYATKDLEWAAVPCGKLFVIIHGGFQVHTVKSLDEAKDYIAKKVKATKVKRTKKSGSGTLEKFL